MSHQAKAAASDTYREEVVRRMSAAMGMGAERPGEVRPAGQSSHALPGASAQQVVAGKLQEALEAAFTQVDSIQARQSISERMIGLFEEILAEMRPSRK